MDLCSVSEALRYSSTHVLFLCAYISLFKLLFHFVSVTLPISRGFKSSATLRGWNVESTFLRVSLWIFIFYSVTVATFFFSLIWFCENGFIGHSGVMNVSYCQHIPWKDQNHVFVCLNIFWLPVCGSQLWAHWFLLKM